MTKKRTYTDTESFTINRKKWFRGRGIRKALLLNDKNEMCCLGFYAIACKIPPTQLINRIDPFELNNFWFDNKKHREWKTKLVNKIGVADDFMEINDSKNIQDLQREKQIINLFNTLNIKVKFEG